MSQPTNNNRTHAPQGQWTPIDTTGFDDDAYGSTPPASIAQGVTWEVRKAGVIVATSAAPNGWNVFWTGLSLYVQPVANAPVGTDYEARYSSGTG